jgi:glycosidase
MRLRLAAVAALLALAVPASAQASFPVTFRFLPDLSSPAIPTVVRAFAPGTMPPGTPNDWGPNTAGNIAPGAASQMTYDAAKNEYRYTETLTVGEDYFYKIHYHTNATAPAYGGTWISDPLNPRLGPTDGNSAVLVTDPMAFQLAREQNGTSQIRVVSASVFGSQAITAITYEINGDAFSDGMSFYDPATRLFSKTLATPIEPGAQFRITATDALGRTTTAEVGLTPPAVVDAPVPAGLRDGITVSGSTATLVLRAPGKRYVYAIGDFSGWAPQEAYVMKRDNSDPLGTRWWTTIPLAQTPTGTRFQYLVDGVRRITDPYSALILDEGSDPFVPAVTFPNRPPYPVGLTSNLVSVIPVPNQTPTLLPPYTRPAPEDLVIYEMLVRDWVSRHDFQTISDSLQYLRRLGVTALELMPVSEFDGNESWGYSPNHYLAVDKYYGPPEALKALINEAHRLGMAVILDVVYNHQTGQSPFVRLFNEGEFGPPTAANPWVNPTGRHPFNVFNDNNHTSALTQYWLDAANAWWLREYRVDGFRYDLSKGFVQTCGGGPCTDANFATYNQQRIDILTRMADALWTVDPNAYVILEHFAEASEERVLASHGRAAGRPGMMLWSNMNNAYNEAAMGYLGSGTDFGRAYPPFNNYPLSGQVTYMESHDEQWLMYKTRTFGACAASPTGGATCNTAPGAYNTRTLATALQRQSLVGAFLYTVPGPKMIWQFGEVGYGGGPGECLATDCPTGTPGRTDKKPIRWDYFSNVAPSANGSGVTVVPTSETERAQRRALYTDWSNLLALRRAYSVFRTPSNVQMNTAPGVADRWIRLEKSGLVVVVVGNFGLTERTSSPPLAAGSTWYDMIGTGTVAGGSTVTLAPGEWRVYANQDLNIPTAGEPGSTETPTFALDAVFPNPTAGRATVRYTLDATADVRLDAYDVLGRRVATLAEGPQAAGAHEAAFDTAGLPAGIYVLRLSAGAQTATARVTVAR